MTMCLGMSSAHLLLMNHRHKAAEGGLTLQGILGRHRQAPLCTCRSSATVGSRSQQQHEARGGGSTWARPAKTADAYWPRDRKQAKKMLQRVAQRRPIHR